MGKKVAFAVSAVYLQPVGVDIQANMGVVIVVVALALHLKIKPFISDSLDNLESASLLTQFITLSVGMFCFSDNSTYSAKILLTIVIFVANGLFVIFAARLIAKSARVKSKMGSLSIGASFRSRSRGDSAAPTTVAIPTSEAPRLKGVDNPMHQGGDGTASKEAEPEAAKKGPQRNLAVEMTSFRSRHLSVDSSETMTLPAPAPVAAPAYAPDLPAGWAAHRTPGGDAYYFNVATGVTSWTLPGQ